MQRARTFLVFAVLIMTATPARAYLDPSTGSMVISAIVGLFASLALGIKTYWYKLKRLFRRPDKPKDDASSRQAD